MGPGQKFLTQIGSIFCCSGRASHLWFGFGFGKFPLKIPNISIFFHSAPKKISWGRVKKYPGQRRVGLKSVLGLVQGPSLHCLLQKKLFQLNQIFMHFGRNWKIISPISFMYPVKISSSAMKRFKQKWEFIFILSFLLVCCMKNTKEANKATAEKLHPQSVMTRSVS